MYIKMSYCTKDDDLYGINILMMLRLCEKVDNLVHVSEKCHVYEMNMLSQLKTYKNPGKKHK